MSVVLGVDVGGSGLRALRVGPAGPEADPLDGGGVAITAGGIDVEQLLAQVVAYDAVHDARPDVVVWSMRGLIGLSDPAAVLRQVGDRLGAGRTVVVSDAVASLVGALGRVGPGAVLAAGSGVVALATDLDRVWRRVDGWGHVLADRGSGAWIGLEGLRAALATEDGVPGGSAALHELAVRVWGPPRGWPRVVMTTSDAPARLAAFAPAVAALAGVDPVAEAICAAAGARLAESLAAVAACGPRAAGDGGRGPAADRPGRRRLRPRVPAAGAGRGTGPGHRPGRRAGPGPAPRAGAPAGRPVAVPAGGLRTRRARPVGRWADGAGSWWRRIGDLNP